MQKTLFQRGNQMDTLASNHDLSHFVSSFCAISNRRRPNEVPCNQVWIFRRRSSPPQQRGRYPAQTGVMITIMQAE